MIAKELIAELKKLNPNLPVEMFAHDQNAEKHDEGDGEVFSVNEIIDDVGV